MPTRTRTDGITEPMIFHFVSSEIPECGGLFALMVGLGNVEVVDVPLAPVVENTKLDEMYPLVVGTVPVALVLDPDPATVVPALALEPPPVVSVGRAPVLVVSGVEGPVPLMALERVVSRDASVTIESSHSICNRNGSARTNDPEDETSNTCEPVAATNETTNVCEPGGTGWRNIREPTSQADELVCVPSQGVNIVGAALSTENDTDNVPDICCSAPYTATRLPEDHASVCSGN